MSSHALVITRSLPDSAERAVHGVFQRMRLFIEAITRHVDHIQILAFTPKGTVIDTDALSLALSKKWNAPLSITVCDRTPNPENAGFWHLYGRGIFTADGLDHYWNIAQSEQKNALRRALAKQPRFLFAHRLQSFSPLLPAMNQLRTPIFFDMDDIEHLALARRLKTQPQWRGERLRMLQIPALMQRERLALKSSANTFVCSEDDANLLRKLSPRATITTIPNTVQAPAAPPPLPETPALGFIGSFVHPPNVDAAKLLVEKVWPLVRMKRPATKLIIAGGGASASLGEWQNKEGIQILDFIPEVGDFYAGITALCAPIRYGAGTRVKIIEAAAWGRATVSTPLGAEGLSFENAREILIETELSAIAESCVRILGDASLASTLGSAARLRFEADYERDRIVNLIAQQFSALLK